MSELVAHSKIEEGGKSASCRFYENIYPEPEDLVAVKITRIGEMGAYVYCSLLEYNNFEGFVLVPEIGRRRIRSKAKTFIVDKIEFVMVIRVDKEKGYIDLSKRRVTPEDAVACEEKYNKSAAVHRVLSTVAKKHDMRLEDLYIQVGWPLYAKFGHAYDAFKSALYTTSDDFTDIFAGLDVSSAIQADILDCVKRRPSLKPVQIREDQEASSSDEDTDVIKTVPVPGVEVGVAVAEV